MAQTGEMTFWDHLEELRGSLFRMIGVYAAAVVVLFFFKGYLCPGCYFSLSCLRTMAFYSTSLV